MNTPDPRALRAWETRRANMERARAEKMNQKKQKGGKDTEQKKPAAEGKPLSAAPNRASREQAFEEYGDVCAHCGFGIKAVLEVAHIDGNRRHNDVANLAILCPNCHKMFDLDLISETSTVQQKFE